MVMKLCTVIELGKYIAKTEIETLAMIKLTKRSLEASFLERLMKEYESNAFGHVTSLAGNTRNKCARFSCINMGTRLPFRGFPLFKVWIKESPNIFKQILADLLVITRKQDNKCVKFH